MAVLFLALALLSMKARAEEGIASVYWANDGSQNGTVTACGPPLNDNAMTAAHKTLPCGAQVRVTNKHNGRSATVTITDRGPYVRGRIIDLNRGAARALGISGIAPVTVERE